MRSQLSRLLLMDVQTDRSSAPRPRPTAFAVPNGDRCRPRLTHCRPAVSPPRSGHNPYIKEYNKAILPHGYYDDWTPEEKTAKL